MSFFCSLGNHNTVANTPMRKITIETRERLYANGSKGVEIVKEIKACQDCLDRKNRPIKRSVSKSTKSKNFGAKSLVIS